MKKNITYTANDGTEFDSEEECLAYEDNIKQAELFSKRKISVDIDGKSVMVSKGDIQSYFDSCKCDQCPFLRECDGLTDFMRRGSTTTYNLCQVIHGSTIGE